MQGWRKDMEDAHYFGPLGHYQDVLLFAVFDGHAGTAAALRAARELPERIARQSARWILCEADLMAETGGRTELRKLITNALVAACVEHDEAPIVANSTLPSSEQQSGCTATMVLLTRHNIIFCNLGDSRSILSSAGIPKFSTVDHKPSIPSEERRIAMAGGYVAGGRVCRCLAVSRAFGDYLFKDATMPAAQRMVSPVPDVTVVARERSADEFLVLACDGIFDVLSNAVLCKTVRSLLTSSDLVSDVCSAIIDRCFQRGSTDNMSLGIVQLSGIKDDRTKIDEWFAMSPPEGKPKPPPPSLTGLFVPPDEDEDISAPRNRSHTAPAGQMSATAKKALAAASRASAARVAAAGASAAAEDAQTAAAAASAAAASAAASSSSVGDMTLVDVDQVFEATVVAAVTASADPAPSEGSTPAIAAAAATDGGGGAQAERGPSSPLSPRSLKVVSSPRTRSQSVGGHRYDSFV